MGTIMNLCVSSAAPSRAAIHPGRKSPRPSSSPHSPERSVSRLSLLHAKADGPPPHLRWCHQLANGLEQSPDALIVAFDLPFQICQSGGQFLMKRQRLAQAHKGPHDGDVDSNGSLAAENAGKHGNAMLGNGIRPRSPATPPELDIAICDFKFPAPPSASR